MDSVIVNRAEFESYDRKLCRLDEFYFSKIGFEKFSNFFLVMKLVLTLSHSQASVERGFSVNENLVIENLRVLSYSTENYLWWHKVKRAQPILLLGLGRQNGNIQLIWKSKRRQRSYLHGKEKRQKVLQDEIDEVLQKKRALEKMCVSLQVDFGYLVSETETKVTRHMLLKQRHWSTRPMRSLKKWKSPKKQLKNLWQRKPNLFDVKKLLLREILKIHMNHVLLGVKLTTRSFTVWLCKSKARVKLFNFVYSTSSLLCPRSLFLPDWAQINKPHMQLLSFMINQVL